MSNKIIGVVLAGLAATAFTANNADSGDGAGLGLGILTVLLTGILLIHEENMKK